MKTVYLLRHAKSSWDNPDLDDHDRPLAPRGEAAAPRIGQYLRAQGYVPARALVSTATRARQTWDLVAPELAPEPHAVYRKDIYDADAPALLEILRDQPDETASVVMVGHNPAMETLAARLAADGDATARQRMAEKYPTATVAALQFKTDRWADLAPGTGTLIAFIRPKDLTS